MLQRKERELGKLYRATALRHDRHVAPVEVCRERFSRRFSWQRQRSRRIRLPHGFLFHGPAVFGHGSIKWVLHRQRDTSMRVVIQCDRHGLIARKFRVAIALQFAVVGEVIERQGCGGAIVVERAVAIQR